MDQLLWLLRVVTPRNLALAGVAGAALYAGSFYRHVPQRLYREWRYPPASAAPDPEISAHLETQQALKIRSRYRRVEALLEEARAAGFEVEGQAAKARAALALERGGFREEAHQVLVDLEMRIPKRRQQYIPMASSSDADEEAWPDEPQPAPAAPARKRRKARAR